MQKILNLKKVVFNPWIMGLVSVIAVIFFLVNIGKYQMNKKIQAEISELMGNIQTKDEVITQEDLAGLPEIVQKWLNNVGVVGKEPIQSMYFKQTGQMRLEPNQNWMVPKAQQYVNTQNPGFLWHVDIAMMPIFNTKGRDLFTNGEGQMLIKVGYLIPVVNEKPNNKINESAMSRFLLELPLYPTAALSEYITWEEIDEKSAKATMNYKGLETSVTLIFDDSSNLLSIETMRYKETDENAQRLKCVGTIIEHKEVQGITIPTKIEITWFLEEGEFTWYKLEIYDIEFNVHE